VHAVTKNINIFESTSSHSA